MIAANAPIEELDFTIGTYNRLKRAGVNIVAQLACLTEDEVLALPQLGWKHVDEIKVNLRRNGRLLVGERP